MEAHTIVSGLVIAIFGAGMAAPTATADPEDGPTGVMVRYSCDPDAFYTGQTVPLGKHYVEGDYTVPALAYDGGAMVNKDDGVQAHLKYVGPNGELFDYEVTGILGALCKLLEEVDEETDDTLP